MRTPKELQQLHPLNSESGLTRALFRDKAPQFRNTARNESNIKQDRATELREKQDPDKRGEGNGTKK